MISLSSVASNRYLKRLDTNAYYSSVSLFEAYTKFPLKNEICFTSFYHYVSDKFKKPHRLTDMCDYCELNKV